MNTQKRLQQHRIASGAASAPAHPDFAVGQIWADRNGDEWRIDGHEVLPMNIIGFSRDVAGEDGSRTAKGKVSDDDDYDGDLVRLVFQGSSLPPIVVGQVWADREGRKWIVTAVGSSKDFYPVAVTPEDGGDYEEEADKSRTITGKTVSGDCVLAGDLIKLVKDAPPRPSDDRMAGEIDKHCSITLDTAAPVGGWVSRDNVVEMVDAPKHYNLPGLGLEWIDVRAALLKTVPPGTPYEAVTSWSEAITYLARMWGKNGVEDARKAEFYIKRMISLMVDL